MRPRVEAAYLVVDGGRRPGPVDGALLARDLRRVGRLCIVLLFLPSGAGRNGVDHLDEQARADLGEIAFDVAAGRLERIGRTTFANMAPASSSFTTRMIVMPVSGSPAMMARWIGAAPRYRGSSDACTLISPSGGVSITTSGMMRP